MSKQVGKVGIALSVGVLLGTAACGSDETSSGTTPTGTGTGGSGAATATGAGGTGGSPVSCDPGTAPEVVSTSGPVMRGAELTLLGCRFGSKDPAAPLKWDDFEAGTDGEDVGNGWLIDRVGGTDPVYPRYSSQHGRGESTRSVHQAYTVPGQYNCNFGLHDADGHTR